MKTVNRAPLLFSFTHRMSRARIRAARGCAVTVEAHPLVAVRTGRDRVECLRFLESKEK
jgi:hypothetical protein